LRWGVAHLDHLAYPRMHMLGCTNRLSERFYRNCALTRLACPRTRLPPSRHLVCDILQCHGRRLNWVAVSPRGKSRRWVHCPLTVLTLWTRVARPDDSLGCFLERDLERKSCSRHMFGFLPETCPPSFAHPRSEPLVPATDSLNTHVPRAFWHIQLYDNPITVAGLGDWGTRSVNSAFAWRCGRDRRRHAAGACWALSSRMPTGGGRAAARRRRHCPRRPARMATQRRPPGEGPMEQG